MNESDPPERSPGDDDDLTVTARGPASEACAVATAQLVGDVNYLVTYRQERPTVGAFDLTERRLTGSVELPAGHGSWASTSLEGGRDLYIGSYGPARLYHVDTADLTVTEAVDPGTDRIHCVEAVPGEETVVFGTKPAQIVYEYDHATGELTDYGQPVPGETYVRSIAVTADTIYAGIGSHAHLVEIDRATGEKTRILPPDLADASYVREVELLPEHVAVGTSDGHLALLDRDDPTEYRLHRVSGEPDPAGVSLLHYHPGTDRLFLADGEGMGRVLCYDPGAGSPTVLVSDVFGARELDTWGDLLVCSSDSQGVFVYRVSGDAADLASRTSFAAAGLPYRPGEVQSIHAAGPRVYVGGHRQTTVHDLAAGTADRIRHRGEPKAMTTVNGELYQAVYPRAKLRRYRPASGTYEELAAIGHRQNRPRAIHHHDPSGRVLVGTRPDYGVLGGAVATYDPSADVLVGVDRDVLADQSVTAIAGGDGVVYLGSEIYGGAGVDPTTGSARIGAWDPVARELEWSMELDGLAGISALVAVGSRLVGLTAGYSDLAVVSEATLFTVDLDAREYDRRFTFEPARAGDLVRYRDTVVGVTANQLFQYDPATAETRILLEELDPESTAWHNFPQVGLGDDGTLFVNRNRELVAVSLPDSPG
ncbi:MAG: hypothetical protein ABEH66_04580 [Halobacteriales archaeon]